MTRAPLIEARNVRKSFNDFVAVEDLSFNVGEGEIVALLGRTGAGKSTVLNLVMGTIKPDAGAITVAGHDPYREFGALRGRIAVSFQTDRLLPWRTAIENAELGLLILGVSKAEARIRAQQWLDRVKLGGAENKYVHELSGGMRQRVSLARALAVDPAIVFLDESFSQLDHVTSRALRGDFSRIAREFGKTCLLVTHRIDDALELADRALILTQGRGLPARKRSPKQTGLILAPSKKYTTGSPLRWGMWRTGNKMQNAGSCDGAIGYRDRWVFGDEGRLQERPECLRFCR